MINRISKGSSIRQSGVAPFFGCENGLSLVGYLPDFIISHSTADATEVLVQFIVSMPALLIIVTNLFFLPLSRILKTRAIATTGLLLYVVAGAGCFFVDDICVLLLLRAILGISVGLIMPLSTGLLAYYCPPEEQARLMGLSAAMNQMGGVVATLLAGLLATIEWNYAFLVYLLGLIALVMVWLWLPDVLMVALGSACIGVANGVGVPYLNTIASIKGGKNSATTVMPLLSAALYLGRFVSPIIVTPASHILFGSADLTGPYKVGIALCLLFMVQVYLTRLFQSLPPR